MARKNSEIFEIYRFHKEPRFYVGIYLIKSMVIVFDLGGVFLNEGSKLAIQRISNKYNLDPEILGFVLHSSFSKEYRMGLISSEDFWKKTKRYLGIKSIEGIKKMFFNSYYPSKGTVEFVKKLKEKGIKIAFLSNGPEDRTRYLDKKFNLINFFDFGFFSFEVHLLKPDKEIYKKFLEKFDLKASDIIYIDDREENLTPAKEVGMKTILFENVGQLEKDLKKFGLKF